MASRSHDGLQRSIQSARSVFEDRASSYEHEPEGEDECRAAVEELARCFRSASGTLAKMVESSRAAASTMSEDRLQVLSEVVQNADDAGATHVDIELLNSRRTLFGPAEEGRIAASAPDPAAAGGGQRVVVVSHEAGFPGPYAGSTPLAQCHLATRRPPCHGRTWPGSFGGSAGAEPSVQVRRRGRRGEPGRRRASRRARGEPRAAGRGWRGCT